MIEQTHIDIITRAQAAQYRWSAQQTEWGHETHSTFFADFTIAELCDGETGVRETFSRAFPEWRTNHIMLTELVVVLNHKMWEHYEAGKFMLSEVYKELWREADLYACEHLKGDEAEYYYRETD